MDPLYRPMDSLCETEERKRRKVGVSTRMWDTMSIGMVWQFIARLCQWGKTTRGLNEMKEERERERGGG